MTQPVSPYAIGAIAIVLLYLVSVLITRRWSPFNLALGHNQQPSTSLMQNLVFTYLTVFAYVTVVAARYFSTSSSQPLPALPAIPLNLLILMGLSITTSVTSKAITLSYLAENRLNVEDQSTLARNRDGKTDLTKIQMLAWTVITVGVYLVVLSRFISAGCYLTGVEKKECPPQSETSALPDVDSALLVLMGASQGGYVAGKLVSRTAMTLTVDHILPGRAGPKEVVVVEGNFFGDDVQNGTILLTHKTQDGSMLDIGIPVDHIKYWSVTRIKFILPEKIEAGKYLLSVRAAGQTGEGKDFEVVAGEAIAGK